MEEKERIKAYETFINNWGEKAQIMMSIEEMSELTKALCKYLRFGKDKLTQDLEYNIKEEIADVYNMVNQLKMMFGNEEIMKIADEKINRTLNKIKEKK